MTESKMLGDDEYQGYDYNNYDEYGAHTGDPNLDNEYNKQQTKMPEIVKNFLVYFKNCVSEGLIFELSSMYEQSWPKLTEDYFEKRPWPEESDVSSLVDADPVFMILYKELYFRHIYARIQGGPTMEQRFNSFYNYCDLFNYILSADVAVPLKLPDLWLWELIDEFIYQFQSFAQYRARLQKKTTGELETLNTNNKVWNVLCVLNVLHSLVDKSNIKQQLEVSASGGDPDSVAGEFGSHPLYKMLGYFSLIGLLRLHSLLGDYYQSIKVLENIEIHKKSQYAHIPACLISTSYYVGFGYMMMRRYSDAIRTFSSILLYIQRTKQLFASKSYQHDQINKQTDQMYHLLAICLVLHPQCIDESIQQTLREKSYHEKMYKMQCGDLQEFENCFVFACPKFLSPCPPPVDSIPEDYSKEAIRHQTQVFMDEVQQQKMLPTIRSYLKLYTTLPMHKLATFMAQNKNNDGKFDIDKETQNLLTHLLCFKHKMKNVVWSKGSSGLEGKLESGSEVFMILYKELYFRHIYARIQGGPTMEQRFNSFYNYCDLFNYILSADVPVPLELPDLWLWELIDEFVYQFQSFAQYRARLQKKTAAELETLNTNNKVWNVLCVLNVLHSLVDKSNIKQQLEVSASGGDPDSVAGEFGSHSLYKMLGYFSLIGLLRLHSLLGDYYQSIKVLENIEIHKKSQYAHIPACLISTSYYVGFGYMMMRRYSDAIRTFSSILLYIQRTKQLFASKSYQHDQINKQTDQMYHLLAICLVLHPQCIDESIQQTLREKSYHEKMYKMQYGDLQEFENCFVFACPKFLSPCPPPVDSIPEDYSKEAIRHQTQVFMDEVQQQKMLPTIRSYLKLYTTLPMHKLATFMAQNKNNDGKFDIDKETQNLLIHLLCFKHKMKNVVWSKGSSGLEGKLESGSELDFYIDNDMIHIADTKVAHRYGDFFIRKILKFEDLNRKLHNLKL